MKSKKYVRNTEKKESIFKRLLRKFKKPIFAIIMILIAVVCLGIYFVIPKYSYKQKEGKILFENPESFCTSKNGWKAIADDRKSIYCINQNEKLEYVINANQLGYKNAEVIDIAFGNENKLYCHIALYNENAYLTDSEVVCELDNTGKKVRDIVYYDYKKNDNIPSHQVKIMGINIYKDNLYYVYKDEASTFVMKVNIYNPQQINRLAISDEGYSEIIKCHSNLGEKFTVLKNNGEVGCISHTGEYEMLYKATYDVRKDEGIFLYDALSIGENVYVLAGQEELTIYKWENGSFNDIIPIKKGTGLSEDTDFYSFGLEEYENKLLVHINEAIYELKGENLKEYNINISLPFNITLCIWLEDYLLTIGVLCLIIGVILGIGNLMKWHLTILSKQILSTIPIVFVMLVVVIYIMFISMINLSSENIIHETIAINEIAASQFKGEELENITGYESVDIGQINELNNRLRKFTNGNSSDWSRNYNLSIFVRAKDEKYVCVANSDESNQFMLNNFSTDEPIDENFYYNSNTFAADVSYGENNNNLQLVLITPIYLEDGSYNAVMLLNASQDSLTGYLISAGISLLINIILLGTLLILVISLVVTRNVKSLKSAKDVITKIASGDFSIRVDKFSKDEVGEICVGVNEMADRLEEYFEEKNKNEQFYYKFVPEKFRELLNKEKFTDLALGDAQSEDLSILFCDIRAFSMNSEMMTAKESFDFVNRIYGKAGPIIRKHNGFVDKYIGDAVMALFESADDAVNAGIELYQAIVLNTNAEEDFGIPSVSVGVGIHSGMARIGIVGEEERMSGTVIADTVNLSSRIESLTKRYGAGMIISKDTLDRMKNPDNLSTRYLGMVQVAGVNEVAALYEVLDCLKDEKREKKEMSKFQFREAVRLYHTGDLKQSLEMFDKLKADDEEDKAAQLYSDYIQKIIDIGNTEHNIFRFISK